MNRRPLVRSLLASATIAAALALAGCDTDGVAPAARSLQPLSAAMLAELEHKNMEKDSPILVRLFKEEAELEVWKKDRSGYFALLKTYPICRWSGELGPKIKEGDRQAPEGFYTITPSLMNPNSNYYLAINMGFPNAYDKANGRTGAFLMIHGDCSSRGCYAMTDEQIAEIYALARESFFGGQRSFQIQAYPFKMTPYNMARHRNSPHMAFWRMLKQGYDHFEVTKQEPKVDVCERRYVFDAESKGKFTPVAKCPAYTVPQDVMAAVKEKQQTDERQMAQFVSQGTPTVPVRMGVDGGMNPIFLSALKQPYVDSAGVVRSPMVALPGTIPPTTRPPGATEPIGETTTASVNAPEKSAAQTSARVASAQSGGLFSNLFGSSSSESSSGGGVVDRMSRLVGLKGSEPAANVPAPKPKPKAVAKQVQTAATARPKPQVVANTAPGAIRPKPEQAQESAVEQPPAKPASSASLMTGAQPTVPAGSFDSRWGTFH